MKRKALLVLTSLSIVLGVSAAVFTASKPAETRVVPIQICNTTDIYLPDRIRCPVTVEEKAGWPLSSKKTEYTYETEIVDGTEYIISSDGSGEDINLLGVTTTSSRLNFLLNAIFFTSVILIALVLVNQLHKRTRTSKKR